MVKQLFFGLLLSTSLVNVFSYPMEEGINPSTIKAEREEETDSETELREQKERLLYQARFKQPQQNVPEGKTTQEDAKEKEAKQAFTNHVYNQAVKRSEEVEDIVHKLTKHEEFDFIIFVGPPGSGKSTLAKVVAEKSGRESYFIHAASLLTKYQNCGNENLRAILDPIAHQKQKCVVVLDEFTQLTRSNSSSKDEIRPEADAAGAVWSILDEYSKYSFMVIIGTTNSLDGVPEALQDRALYIIPVPRANKEALKEAITRLLGPTHNCTQKYIDYLAKKASGQSYREVERAIKKAITRADKKGETVGESHIKPFIQEWYSPYNPIFIITQGKKNLKPFLKEVLPIVLQGMGLWNGYYFSMLQTSSTAKQLEMQKHGLEMQEEGLETQEEGLKSQKDENSASAIGKRAIIVFLATEGAKKALEYAPEVIEIVKRYFGF